MNYIGSKNKLSSFIEETIKAVTGDDLSDKTFCDIFAGTGIIGRKFKPFVKEIISNDIEFYSYVLIRNYIGNNRELPFDAYLEKLNNLKGKEGFIYKHYCTGSGSERKYFSDENGRRIDAMRQQIELWKENKEISEDLYYFLLASLIESADKVANTASVYAGFLKKIKKTSKQILIISPSNFLVSYNSHKSYN